MSTLAVTNTLSSGNVVRASEHNQNYSDIVTWANGNIADDNFDTFTGAVVWSVTTNALSIQSTNTGTEGSVTVAHNGTLASGKSALKLTSNAAQSTGTAILEIAASSASNDIPALKITDAGGGGSAALQVVSTTKASLPYPKMTTTQRDAMDAPAEGMGIYNTTLKRYEMYDGTNWVDMAGRTGTVVDFAGSTLPDFMLACDGSSLLRSAYPALFAKIGTTWGAADGTHFNLPDCRGRATIGSGTGSGLTARALADLVGAETLPAHTHSFSATSSSNGAHTHAFSTHSGGGATADNTGGSDGTGFSANTDTSSNGAHTHTISGTSGSTGTGTHGVMQPSVVINKAIII